MGQWELHDKHPSTSFGKIVKRHISAADADNVDRMLSAYEALYKGNYKSPGEIRRSFTKDGQPLFTKEQAKSVYRQIRKGQTGGERIESIVNSLGFPRFTGDSGLFLTSNSLIIPSTKSDT